MPSLDATETEGVLNILYDLGETVPVKTTEAHHFRRVCLQRAILARRGIPAAEALDLGPLYRRLRQRIDSLGLTSGPQRPRRPPLQVSAGNGFVFVSHRGQVHPSGFPCLAVTLFSAATVSVNAGTPTMTSPKPTASYRWSSKPPLLRPV